ncbi:MAG: c-type cytochrome [Caldilineaceae bacterium]
MENNRRSLVVTLGPWLGVILLLLGLRAGANHLRSAQEELIQQARAETLTGPAAGSAEVSQESTQNPEDSANDASAQSTSVTTDETVAGEVTTATVSSDTSLTGTAVISSEMMTDTVESRVAVTETTATPAGMGMGMGQGGGMGRGAGGGMTRMFHMATIPDEYAGKTSPVPADEESLSRGAQIFTQNCVVCHGETGLGDGVAAATLNPPPPAIAVTSQMLGDDYLFWRISEGGAMEPFNSAMPTWKAVLNEDQRWDVINYVRSLGRGQNVGAGQGPGVVRTAEMEEAMRTEMLAAGIEQGVLTQDQADLFDTVHSKIDALRAAEPDRQFTGTMRDLQDQLLEELVADGEVTQEDADTFNSVLNLLQESGLMQ